MKKRSIILVIFCLIVAIYLGINTPYDPLSLTIRHSKNGWGEAVSLTPEPFQKGAPEAVILAELKKAKYEADPSQISTYRQLKSYPKDSLHYSKRASALVCFMNYEIIVRFDSGHRLLEGWGTYYASQCF